MTKPRKEQISLSETPYYHLVSRCVRRSFLCGYDNQTQQSYEHRRQWIVDRIRLLSSLFTVNLCSYAVMSNHYHLVIKIDPSHAELWSDTEVIKRWTAIYKGPLIIQQWLAGRPVTNAEKLSIDSIVSVWRKRLCDISWFMKCLNEPIARRANQEDGCTGHFWESRYKSQALPTDNALLSCMVYVDLNPIRAGLSETPETSDYTSIQERIKQKWDTKAALANQDEGAEIDFSALTIKPLAVFQANNSPDSNDDLPINYIDYLKLVDWTGRVIRDDKRGFIPEKLPPIVQRLELEVPNWTRHTTQFEHVYQRQFSRKQKTNSR